MKGNYDKFPFLELIFLLFLVSRLSVTETFAINEREFRERHSYVHDATSTRDNKIWDLSTISNFVAPQVKKANGNEKLPKSKEAKDERIVDITKRKIPNQSMNGSNISSIVNNHKKVIKENYISNLQAENDNIFYSANPMDVSNLLGSIEDSVRKDYVDLSKFTRKDGGMKSFERLESKLGIAKLDKKHEKITKGLKDRGSKKEAFKEQKSHRNVTRLMSAKRLESSLLNEGRKKTNENMIIHNENLTVEKNLDELASGERYKKVGEWGVSGSGDEGVTNADNNTKFSQRWDLEYGSAIGSAKVESSEAIYGNPRKLANGKTGFTPTIKRIKEVGKNNKQLESLAEVEGSDGYDNENNDYNEENEVTGGYDTDDSDNKADKGKYSNDFGNEETNIQNDDYSVYMTEFQNGNKDRQENMDNNANKYVKNVGAKEDTGQSTSYEKGKFLHYAKNYGHKEKKHEDYNEKMPIGGMLDEETSGGQELGEKKFGEQISNEQTVSEQAFNGQQSGKEQSDEQVSGEKNSEEQASGEQKVSEQVSGEQKSGEQESGEQSLSEQTSGEQKLGEEASGEETSGEETSGEETSGEKTSGEETWDEQASSEQESGEAYSSNMKESLRVVNGRKGFIKNYSIYSLMVPRKSKHLMAARKSKPETLSSGREQNASKDRNGQSSVANSGIEMEDSIYHGSAVKQWQEQVAYNKEDITRDNSKLHEGISGNNGELPKSSYGDFEQRKRNSTKENIQNSTNGNFMEYHPTTNETKEKNSSSFDFMNGNATNNLNNSNVMNLKHTYHMLAESANNIGRNNHTNFTLNNISNNSSTEKGIVEEKNDNTLQELNKEIKAEEDKSRDMINYLETIDKELGEEINESAKSVENESKFSFDKNNARDLTKFQSYGVRTISIDPTNKILMKTNKSMVHKISRINGISRVENEEEVKEHLQKKQNALKGLQNSTTSSEDKKILGLNQSVDNDNSYANKFVKRIFGDLEQMIETKLEGEMNAENKERSGRKENYNQEKNYDSTLEKIVEKVTRNSLQIKEPHSENMAIHKRMKFGSNDETEPAVKKSSAHKSAIIIDLHEKNTPKHTPDKSKRTERPTTDNAGDIILSYKKIYGTNSTLIADFSDGEAGAKLYIIPKTNEENAQKKNIVVKNEAGEKRSGGADGIHRWIYFGIGTEVRKRSYQDNQDIDGPGGRIISGLGPRIRSRAIDALYRDHRFPNEPSSKEILQQFDAPTGVGYQYGQLMWGWFIAPMDGEYTFFSSCDDECDVYLSPDQGKDRIKKILSQTTWSPHNVWDKDPTQQTSMAIRLGGGRSYYIQAVGAQSGGGDGLSVGVQMPNGVMVRPITRHFLARAPLGPSAIKQLSPDLQKAQANDMAAAAANGGNANLAGAVMAGGTGST